MELRVNAETTEGEKVVIVKKEIKDGARPFESQILTSEDGRTFRPLGGGQVEELTVMDAGETEYFAAQGLTPDPKNDDETPMPDSEQAAEAPTEDGEEEADS